MFFKTSLPYLCTGPGSPQSSTVQLHYVHMRGIPFHASGEDIVEVNKAEENWAECIALFEGNLVQQSLVRVFS